MTDVQPSPPTMRGSCNIGRPRPNPRPKRRENRQITRRSEEIGEKNRLRQRANYALASAKHKSEGISFLYSVGKEKEYQLGTTKVKATAIPTILAKPERIEFEREGNHSKIVSLSHRLQKPFRIIDVTSNHPSVSVRHDSSNAWIETRFDPSVRGWELVSLVIRIQTDSEEERNFELPVVITK